MKELTLVNEDNISLREAVYLTLRRAILTNVFEPGDRLMEMKLAAQLGVSRTPVREAIHLLIRVKSGIWKWTFDKVHFPI